MDPDGWREGMRTLFTLLIVSSVVIVAIICSTLWVLHHLT